MAMHLGIEIEYLVAGDGGQPVKSGYGRQNPTDKGHAILKRAAAIVGTHKTEWDGTHTKFIFQAGKMKDATLMPDTFTLLETVTHHSDDLDLLRDQLWSMKKALIQASKEYSSWISGAACPLTYPYNVIDNPNSTFNNAGMHIHVDARTDRDKIKLANLIAQIIPELTALCANSSIYNKSKAGKHTKRLSVSTLASAKMVEVMKFDPTKELKWDNPNKRYRWVTQFPKGKKTVEIRGFDTPMNVDWAMAIAALVLCIGEKARHLFINRKANTIVSGVKEYRIDNFEAAVEKGMKAEFKVDPTYHRIIGGKKKPLSFLHHDPEAAPGSKISATLAAKRLLYYIEDEAYDLGLLEYLEPFYKAVKSGKNQAEQQIEWFDKGSFISFLDTLAKECSKQPENKKTASDGGRKYFLVRQRSLKAKVGTLEFSEKAMKALNLKTGEAVVVSGPLGSVKLKSAEDSRRRGRRVNDREVGLSGSARRRLGVSMFDPVIVGKQEIKPYVIQKTGADWYSVMQSSPRELTRSVIKGFKDPGPGTAIVSGATLKILRISEGGKAFVWKDKTKAIEIKFASKKALKNAYIGLMKKDRDALGTEVGDRVHLSKKRPKESPAPRETGYFKVRQGFTSDSDEPVIVRLHKSSAEKLGVKDKDSVSVSTKSGNMLEAIACLSSDVRENEAALRKKARQKLDIKEGDSVKIKKLGPAIPESGFIVRQGFKEDKDDEQVVRLNPAAVKRLELEERKKIVLESAAGKKIEAIVLASEKCGINEAAIRESLRNKLGVKAGEKISIKLAQIEDQEEEEIGEEVEATEEDQDNIVLEDDETDEEEEDEDDSGNDVGAERDDSNDAI
jgi:hypothetical protein